jgi:hypothetical protein
MHYSLRQVGGFKVHKEQADDEFFDYRPKGENSGLFLALILLSLVE